MNQESFTKKCGVTAASAVRNGSVNRLGALFALFLIVIPMQAQRGGERVFEFVHLASSARATALGGSQIAAWVNDYGLVGGNPAMLNATMNNSFIFQHNFHFAGVDNGYAGYARFIPSLNSTIHAGIHYMSYGDFTAADEYGNVNGSFKANELSINAGIAKAINERLSAGVQLQYVQSALETYQSNGFLLDAGLSYQSEDGLNHYAFVVRGLGVQLTPYYEGDEKGRMPVDVQLGYSKRLQYVPFRLSILLHDLNRWDLRYDSPLDENTGIGFGEEPKEPSEFGQSVDNVFRHITFGGEFLIGKKETLQLRVGYNHQRRKELSVVNLRSLAGFSAGVGIHLKPFVLDYGFAVYHQAGSSKHLGLRVHLDQLKRKKIVE